MDPNQIGSTVMNLMNEVRVLTHRAVNLENQLRSLTATMDRDYIKRHDPLIIDVSTHKIMIEELSRRLEDLHSDLENGDVGQVRLTEELLKKLILTVDTY